MTGLVRIVVLLSSVVAAACAPPPSGEPDRAGSNGEPGGGAISLVDDAGRTVHLPRPATRVISLVPSLTELMLALGAADRLIARTDFDLDPAIAHLPSAGPGLTPSLEWIATQRPDLVLAWPDPTSRSIVARLEALDIPVYNARPELIGDMLRNTRALGRLLGLEAKADSLANAVTRDFDAVRAETAGLAPVSVLYLIELDPPRTASAGTFIHELIEAAGGRNLFADLSSGWPEVSLESIVRRRPDLIVIAQGQWQGQVADRLRGMPGWREVEAVRAGRVVELDPFLFNRAGPRIARAARVLADVLHPGLGLAHGPRP